MLFDCDVGYDWCRVFFVSVLEEGGGGGEGCMMGDRV